MLFASRFEHEPQNSRDAAGVAVNLQIPMCVKEHVQNSVQ